MAASRASVLSAILIAAAFVGAVALVRARWSPPYASCAGTWTRIDTTETCGACGVRCASIHGAASCVSGRCQIACEAGFSDCDGHPGNGCETNLTDDRAHCGSCTKVCSGARCENGACAARHLATGAGITSIVADDRAVYAIGTGIMKYPLDGSDAVVVTRGDLPSTMGARDDKPSDDSPSPPRGALQRTDGEDAYWVEIGAEGSVVKKAPKRGGEGALVASHPHRIWALATNATHVFWVDDKQRIFMASKKPG